MFACVLAGSVGFTREFVAPCERVRLFLSPSVKAALPASSLRSDATEPDGGPLIKDGNRASRRFFHGIEIIHFVNNTHMIISSFLLFKQERSF